MTEFVLAGGQPQLLLSHLAFYGLTAILADAGHYDLTLSWTRGMTPRPTLAGADTAPETVATAVHAHAGAHHTAGAWPTQTITLGGTPRGVMSPRITTLPDTGAWEKLQKQRHSVLD